MYLHSVFFEIMAKVTIFLPKLQDTAVFYYMGCLNVSENNVIIIYITNWSKNRETIRNYKRQNRYDVYGYYNMKASKKQAKLFKEQNLFEISYSGTYQINRLIISNMEICVDSTIIMFYDYKIIRDCEHIPQLLPGDMFSKLYAEVQSEQYHCLDEISIKKVCKPVWLSATMFGQHFVNYAELILWLILSIIKQKRVSLKQGNMILAIIADVLIGYFVLSMLNDSKEQLSYILMNMLEKLVNYLYSLLKWLMGAPAGLKLNNAFNKMLGKYFSYHIQLWWLFLDVSGGKLDVILDIYHYIGYLGFTFQAAIISDMICIATFHSYCIYVYAARLFNIQISGLTALMRLFFGRKYNPLRGGIDSCEYTNQELFVGTVAFAILLFLLPTTAMYYIVFTLFRLLSLIVQHILSRTIYFLQTIPLYTTFLWCIGSSRIAGDIFIEVLNGRQSGPLVVKVNILTLPLQKVVKYFTPPVEAQKPVVWTGLFTNLLTGKQII